MDYNLIFVNNSSQLGSACVYQQDPGIGMLDVLSLAWFSKAAAPTSRVQFNWTGDYSFVWSETGTLVPGAMFTASQTWDADLSRTNQVQFTYLAGGAYTFQNQTHGPRPGSLYILEDGTIPPNQASVGIGMGGSGTFVMQAQPNMQAIFTPTPQYWITFGNYIQGEVLDLTTINNPAEIVFPPNVYSMTAILSPNNTWTVAPTSSINRAFGESRKNNPEALWGVEVAA